MSEEIFKAVLARRDDQDRKWGGPQHDDLHTEREWCQFVRKYLDRYGTETDAFEDVMLDVAALAVAAIQSYARKDITRKALEGK